jgi:hypothetical protein
MIVELSLQRQI